jgi:hypothetical protein
MEDVMGALQSSNPAVIYINDFNDQHDRETLHFGSCVIGGDDGPHFYARSMTTVGNGFFLLQNVERHSASWGGFTGDYESFCVTIEDLKKALAWAEEHAG